MYLTTTLPDSAFTASRPSKARDIFHLYAAAQVQAQAMDQLGSDDLTALYGASCKTLNHMGALATLVVANRALRVIPAATAAPKSALFKELVAMNRNMIDVMLAQGPALPPIRSAPAKADTFRTHYPEAMSPTTREQLRLADVAHNKMAQAMTLLACAARGETDAKEAAWEALEKLRGGFTAVADHLAAPDACALILGGQYQVGYTSGAAYSASFIRSLSLSAWRLADEVALAEQKGGAL